MATLAYTDPGFQSLGNEDETNSVFMTNGADTLEYRATGTLNVDVGLSDGDVFQFTEFDGTGFTYSRFGNTVTIRDGDGNEVANLGGLGDGETIKADFGDDGTVEISRSGEDITVGETVLNPNGDEAAVDPSDGGGTARTVSVDSSGTDDAGNDSTEDAGTDDVAFTFAPGDYTYTIDGFSSGDSLNFASSAAVTVLNTDVSDGEITVRASDGPSETTATVVLEGLSNAEENSAFNVPSFRDTFGDDSLNFGDGGADTTAPTVTDITFAIPETAGDNTTLGTVEANDDTAVTSLAITGGNTDVDNDGNGAFAIADDGTLTVNDGGDLDFESGTTSFALTVEASDAAGNTGTGTVTVNVTDTDDGDDDDGGAVTEIDLSAATSPVQAQVGTAEAFVLDVQGGASGVLSDDAVVNIEDFTTAKTFSASTTPRTQA